MKNISSSSHQDEVAALWRKRLVEAFWTWLLSLVFMIVVPCLPLAIEAAKNTGVVKPDSLYMTAAVLAASYGIATDHMAFRFGYSCGFFAPLILLYQPETGPKWVSSGWAVEFMVAVATLHALERFRMHVVLNRGFPDWLKGP